MTLSFRLIGILTLSLASTTLSAQQINVVNQGMLITIQQGATLSINGDYTDNSGVVNLGVDPNDPGLVLDAPIFLSGTLYVSGNLNNNSSTSTTLIYEFENALHTGNVVLNGTGVQRISGSVNSYFPNLTLNKSGGSLILDRDILIDNALTFTQGVLTLNNRTISLGQHGSIASENETNKILETVGSVVSAKYQVSTPPTSVANYRGLGIGYNLGVQNFADVVWTRIHGIGNYSAANGKNVLRAYRMETTSSATFPSITFYYHDSELNTLTANASIALYFSNDNGVSWTKATSTVDPVARTVKATNVSTAAGTGNIFTLAESVCSTLPSATIVSAAPPVTLGVVDICDNVSLDLSVPNVGTNDYVWTTPVGPASTYNYPAFNVDFDAPSAQSGAYSVFVRDIKGCENTGAVTVHVRAIPVAQIAISPDPNVVSLCFGNQLQFSDASTVAGGSSINQWAWDFNDAGGATSAIENPQFTYTTVGDKLPALRVTSNHNCVSPWVNRPITIQSLPTPSFQITDGVTPITQRCEDTDITLVNGSTYLDYNGVASSTLSYQWTFDDGNSATATSPVHQYAAAGTYDIVLRATVDVTQCYSETTAQIIINPEPIPQFTPMIGGVGVNEGCEGVYVNFQNSSTMPGGTPMTFNWDFADGTSSTQVSPVKQYIAPSVYSVQLTATSVQYGCFESFTFNLTEHPAPKGTFMVADPDICVPEQAVLTNSSTVDYGTLTNQWDFGDGNIVIDNAAQVNHNYTNPQQYKITLTRTTDEGCTNSVSRNVIVHPNPVASFVHVSACDGEEVVFYNNSIIQSDDIQSYSWDFGHPSGVSAQTEPKHVFPAFGDYSVSLTATSTFGCTNTINNMVAVYRNPSFNLGASITGCQTPFTIDPSADGAAYLPLGSSFVWKNSQSQTIGNSEALQASASDVYSVTITTPAPEQCVSTIPVPLFLFKAVNLGADIEACSAVVLNAETGLAGEKNRPGTSSTYEWQKDGIVVSTEQTLNVVESGVYKITLTRTVGGNSCSTIDEVNVLIDIPLSVSLPPQQTICEGESVILDAAVEANSYHWTRLNTGEVFSGQTLEVTQGGDYRVDVTTNGCTATAIATVIVSPGPSVSFQLPSLSACVGAPIDITDYSYTDVGAISNRVWDFGDNTSSVNPPVVSKIYNVPGAYDISLTATTDNGCGNAFTQQIIIHANPVADFSIQDGCEDATLQIVNSSTPGAVSAWDFGDGSVSNVTSPDKLYEDDGQYTVTLNVVANGCSASVDKIVTVNPLPDIEFGDQVTTCGNSIQLDGENSGATFRWFDPTNGNATLATTQHYIVNASTTVGLEIVNGFGCQASDVTDILLNVPVVVTLGPDRSVCDEEILDAGYFPGASFNWSSGETTRELTATTSGFYQVNVIDQNGCSASASLTLTVNSTPVIAAIPTQETICSGDQLLLDVGSNVLYNYLWSTGATTSGITVTAAGSYSVSVTNQDCMVEKTILVTENQSPVAAFSAENECKDDQLVFQNNSTASAGGLQYLWNFGDGTFSTQAEPVKIFATTGVQNVSLQVTDEKGCVDQQAGSVEIYQRPVAEFQIADACSTNNLVINNTSSSVGTLDYQWNFGNGQTSTAQNPVYAYPVSGTYQVNLLVTSPQGCNDNFLQNVTVGTTPSLLNWANQLASCNSAAVLDAGNAGANYEWSDNTTNQTLTVTQSGQYSVEITSPDGCAITANANVILHSPAVPMLADVTEDCGSVHLDPVANAATYLWSNGAQTKTITVSASGNYSVQMITQNLCISNDQTEAVVNVIPVIDLGADLKSCVGETVSIDATSNVPVTYEWSTGETTSGISVSQSGKYVVKLTSVENCVFRDSLMATFHSLPVIPLNDEVISCGEVTLDAANPGSSYVWSTGSTQRTLNISASGSYWIEVTNANNCVAKEAVAVTILPVPVVALGPDVTLCNGQTKSFDAGTGGNQYLWSDNSTARHFTAGATGTYQVSVTNSVGCVGSDNVRVTVRPPLGLNLGADRLLCSNAGQVLSAGVDNVSYLWGSTNGTNATTKTIKVERSGTYWVQITDGFSCTAKDSVTVSPTTENITANFLVPTAVGQGDLVHFVQLSEPTPTTFRWTFGDGGLSNEENPIHRYFRTGDFTATLIVSNSVCTDTLSKTITVRNGRVEVQPSPELPKLIEFISASSYPNPTRGLFTVDLALTAEAEVWVAVYSLKGVTMDERRKTIVQDVFEFDITDASDGMYIIRVIVEGKVRIFKVLKSGGF